MKKAPAVKKPYAYLRKSRVFRDRRAVSPEMQLAEVQTLAERHGDTALVVLEDLNISGRKGRSERPAFSRLIAALEAGEVSAIYSYSLSRLSRSMRDILELAELAGTQGVPIHLVVDPDPDPTSPSGKLILSILAAMAAFEADVATERARDTADQRRARGEKLGPAFYRDTDAVVDAYREAGSIIGAARLLTSRGVPTATGKSDVWQPTSVRGILARVGVLPPHGHRGAKKAAPFLFYRLLKCGSCKRFLTGVRYAAGKQEGYVTYRCLQGRVEPGHGKQSVAERSVIEWARSEAARIRPPVDRWQIGDSSPAQREALLNQRDLVGRAFLAGLWREGDEAFAAELKRIDEELEALDQAEVVTLEPIAWHGPVELVNAALRATWKWIELDREQRPVRAEWWLPAWRAED